MKHIDVVYFVEHVARELDIACAVRHRFQQRTGGTMEILGIGGDLAAALKRYHPRAVALPFCTSIDDFGVADVVRAWPEARYLNLSFEQVLGKTQKRAKAPRDHFARHRVLHLAWGEFFARFLEDAGVPREHIVVNGNPTYALYQPPYQAYYGDPRRELAQRYGLDPEKRWAFIPENYGWAFFSDRLVRDRIRRGFDPDDAYRYRDFARRSLKEAARWWVEATAVPQVEVVVRPRPAIPRELFVRTMEESVGNIPDMLHIIKEGSVREWLFASDVVFSSYSTTLLEAAITRKPLYMLAPHPFPDFLYAEWYPLAETVESGDAFVDVLTRPRLENNWQPLEAWVRRNMMSNGDAIANLAALLAKMVDGRQGAPPPLDVAAAIRQTPVQEVAFRARKMGWGALYWASKAVGGELFKKHWMAHEDDRLSPVEIQRRTARWAEILGEG